MSAVRKIDPADIPLRRAERFFGDGGICERYERLGDELVQFHEVAEALATVGVNEEDVITRLRQSARYGEFGDHRSRVDRLISLDGWKGAPPTAYYFRVTRSAVAICSSEAILTLRARRSVWVEWLKSQGWAVPTWLHPTPPNRSKAAERNKQPRRRGPKPTKSIIIEAKMKNMPRAELEGMKEEEMAARFGAVRSTCAGVRRRVLAEDCR